MLDMDILDERGCCPVSPSPSPETSTPAPPLDAVRERDRLWRPFEELSKDALEISMLILEPCACLPCLLLMERAKGAGGGGRRLGGLKLEIEQLATEAQMF